MNEVTWRKATLSFANGNCVEAAGEWAKSSYSGANGSCVEVATGGCVAIRDTKNRAGGTLHVTPAMFTAFTNAIKAGDLCGA